MASEQAFIRFQMNRLDQEMHRLTSHLERLMIAKGAVSSSVEDNLERMIQRAQDELDHVSRCLSSIAYQAH